MSFYQCLLFGLNCVILMLVSVWHHVHHACQKYSLSEVLISTFCNISAQVRVVLVKIFSPTDILVFLSESCFKKKKKNAVNWLEFSLHLLVIQQNFLMGCFKICLRVWLDYTKYLVLIVLLCTTSELIYLSVIKYQFIMFVSERLL